ncbi:histidine phosphatase family protein [Hespellia stercorisuis]|uniref:Probable phosphoglycerate mutase n=1 Tax=Hespellia stercorisuis DSM 15480 TaxID=1121950 RepID=A0A1M6J797_9FIRM|nr:histidine phosphatase family protein [Hespellia stercorisuis]SHJ42558.1 probable phosphoglycerate mutase [Hespellia stercorisuis DSM 15480]
MKTKVIMIRHGETDWNVLCKFLGSADRLLTEKGRRQAGYARAALQKEQIAAIYSSPMLRAYETGEIIRGDRDIPIIRDDGLIEINCGAWEGLDGNEVEKKYPGQMDMWANHPERLQIDGGGDSFVDVQNRIVEAFWRIVNANRGKTILITSHMICLTLLLIYFDKKEIKDMWNVKPLANGALNIVEVSEDDRVEITAWSDDTFVPEEDKKGSVLVAGRNYIDEE